MAKEAGATVLFLYVVDVEFLKLTARGVRHDVVLTEMEHMGEFLLAMACERAEAQGVKAESCLQHGPLLQALESATCAEGVDAIAFGRPVGPDSSFSLPELEELTAKLEDDTGVKTYIL